MIGLRGGNREGRGSTRGTERAVDGGQRLVVEFDAVACGSFTQDHGNQYSVCETAETAITRAGAVPVEPVNPDQVLCGRRELLGGAQDSVHLNRGLVELVTGLGDDARDIGEDLFALTGAERSGVREKSLEMGHALTFLVKWADKGGCTRRQAHAGLKFAKELTKKALLHGVQQRRRSKVASNAKHMRQREHAQ